MDTSQNPNSPIESRQDSPSKGEEALKTEGSAIPNTKSPTQPVTGNSDAESLGRDDDAQSHDAKTNQQRPAQQSPASPLIDAHRKFVGPTTQFGVPGPMTPSPTSINHTGSPISPMPQATAVRRTSNTITLKTPVFILIITAIVIALIVGFLGGAATMYRGAASQIASAQGDAANWKRAYEDLSQSQDSPDSQSDSSKDTTTGKSSDSNSGSSSGSGNTTKTKGETETNGTLDLTFNSMEEIASVPQEWNGTQPDLTPTEGTRFISVKVHIVNNGQQPVDLTCGYVVDIRAVNSSNQQYTPIDDLFKIPGNPECNADLQPGMGADMQYVFNVPQNAKMVGFGWRDVTDISANNDYSTFRF